MTPTGKQLRTDAANPRTYADEYTRSDGSTQTNRGNVNGHIIRWREAGGQAAATTFQLDVYLFGAQADAPATSICRARPDVNDFSSPDGLCFDRRGMLWIQTHDGAYTDVSNCMMLAAVPGQVVTAARQRRQAVPPRSKARQPPMPPFAVFWWAPKAAKSPV